ncbi:MAG: hypothetical protein M3Y86_12705 [Verrucomicrobiota bacterium]|nr:hypothetical protein [Verrucomicrobiota bacterium]
MPNPEPATAPQFFFALPRLIASWRGGDAGRSEKNAVESNAVGALVHLVVYAFAFHLCLTSRPWWLQLLAAVPLAFLVWIFWLNLFYANALLLRLLRSAGLMRELPQSRAQGILIGILATAFAGALLTARDWTRVVAVLFLVLVLLNFLAALILARHALRPNES